MLKIYQLKQAKGPAQPPRPLCRLKKKNSLSKGFGKPAGLAGDFSVFLLLSPLVHHAKWPVVHGDSIFYPGVQQLIQHKRKRIALGSASTALYLCLLPTSVLHEQAPRVSWALVREIRFYEADNVSLEGRVSPPVQRKPVYRALPAKNAACLRTWPWLTSRSLSW